MSSTSYVVSSLYDSNICRLCCVENNDGLYLFDPENNIKSLINHYLPLKVHDDGKLPRTICPGCHIQLASTMQFFNLIVEGQTKLREIWNEETTILKSLDKEKEILARTLDGVHKISFLTDGESVDRNIVVKVFSDAAFFEEDHEMTLRVEGLDKPKKKRGRPRKKPPEEVFEEPTPDFPEPEPEPEPDEGDFEDSGRRLRRRRKPPQRYQEALAGKELERVLVAEGAADPDSETEPENDVVAEPVKQPESEVDKTAADREVIGHLTTADGQITETILANRHGKTRKKREKPKYTCDFCAKSFQHRNRWIRHRSTHRGLVFLCTAPDCGMQFSSRCKINMHQSSAGHTGCEIAQEVGSNLVEFQCCGKVFTNTDDLTVHANTEHDSKANLNSLVLPTMSEVDASLENSFPEPVVASAPLPENEGKGEGEGSTERKHKCDMCTRCFNHQSSLVYHKESMHNNGAKFCCSKCSREFNHKQLLQRHQMVHSNDRPFACRSCGLSFKTKSNLMNHRSVHTGEKKFVCNQCGQSFAHRTSLNLHESWHKGLRPFKCTFCQKSFSQNGNLREHLRIHNGEKPYACTQCDKVFTTSSQKRFHMKRHTGEKPWKCQYCPKKFLHKDTWRTHERRHTGEKPYLCPYCTRAFSELWALRKHIRLHTGEKPYKCDECGKKFADCSNLTKHKKVHALQSTPGKMWNEITSQLGEVPESHDSDHVVVYSLTNDAGDVSLRNYKGTYRPTTRSTEIPVMESEPALSEQMAFVDEEGNPVQVSLRNGSTAEIVSLDIATNIVQVRTSEGAILHVQFPPNKEIIGEDMIEQIQTALSQSKLLPEMELGPEDMVPERDSDMAPPREDLAIDSLVFEDELKLKRALLNGETFVLLPGNDSITKDHQSVALRIANNSEGLIPDFAQEFLTSE